jgi:hypothetical protein
VELIPHGVAFRRPVLLLKMSKRCDVHHGSRRLFQGGKEWTVGAFGGRPARKVGHIASRCFREIPKSAELQRSSWDRSWHGGCRRHVMSPTPCLESPGCVSCAQLMVPSIQDGRWTCSRGSRLPAVLIWCWFTLWDRQQSAVPKTERRSMR